MAIAELQWRPIDHVLKIATWKKYGLDEVHIMSSYHALGVRPQPITIAEGRLLGVELSLRLAALRDKVQQGVLDYLQESVREDVSETLLAPAAIGRTKDLICRAMLVEFIRD